jgi:hypothetical protein
MRRWRGDFDNPLVKVTTGLAVSLFLALNFPLAFLAIVIAAVSYVTALVGVVCAYRNRYRIVGKPELTIRFAAKTLANLRMKCRRSVARTLEERERRKGLKHERNERLRRYERERNRKKRRRARGTLA